MSRRIFIAINLPENIKKELISFQKKWFTLPVKWVRADNLHITLAFLGQVPDQGLVEVIKTAQEIAKKHSPFVIKLVKILYGPPKKMPPRLIWVEGEKTEELSNLQKDLESSLLNVGGFPLAKESRPYSPHITLGRIKAWQFRQIEPEERPEVNEEVDLNFEVSSVEVMESQLKRSGPEYTILETCPLFK